MRVRILTGSRDLPAGTVCEVSADRGAALVGRGDAEVVAGMPPSRAGAKAEKATNDPTKP